MVPATSSSAQWPESSPADYDDFNSGPSDGSDEPDRSWTGQMERCFGLRSPDPFGRRSILEIPKIHWRLPFQSFHGRWATSGRQRIPRQRAILGSLVRRLLSIYREISIFCVELIDVRELESRYLVISYCRDVLNPYICEIQTAPA